MLNVVDTLEAVFSRNYRVFIDISRFLFRDFLFHCHRLSKIARMIYVCAFCDRHVIGQ